MNSKNASSLLLNANGQTHCNLMLYFTASLVDTQKECTIAKILKVEEDSWLQKIIGSR